MYNPRILEVNTMFNTMVNKHAGELDESYIDWFQVKDPDGFVVQCLPRVVLLFKG